MSFLIKALAVIGMIVVSKIIYEIADVFRMGWNEEKNRRQSASQ